MRTLKLVGLFIAAFATLMCFSQAASAAQHNGTGYVYSIATFSPVLGYNDAIELQGVTSLGSCPVDSNTGYVIIRFTVNSGSNPTADRLYTLALTAFTTGKKLQAYVDDTVLLNSDCEALYFVLR